MIYNWRMTTCSFFIAIFFLCYSCVTKVYTDERMAIDSSFLELFNSIAQKDTFSFKNSKGSRKAFVIIKIDSAELNKKGWFINGSPFKTLEFNFREIGIDTTPLYRNNEISVSKAPVVNENGISIQFNNFYFSEY